MEHGFGHTFGSVQVQAGSGRPRIAGLRDPGGVVEERADRRAAVAMKASGSAPLKDGSGADFENVRIRTGPAAELAARAARAQAFTVGGDIVFGAGHYAPATEEGNRLLAHELAHVAEQSREGPSSLGWPLDRQAETGSESSGPAEQDKTPAPQKPEDETKPIWKWKDLTTVPLLKDIWNDLIRKELKEEELAQLKLKGTEAAAFYVWAAAVGLATAGSGGEALGGGFGKSIGTVVKYAGALQPLTPSKRVFTDGFSRLIGLRVDEYFKSDAFKKHLATHRASLVTLGLAGWGLDYKLSGGGEKGEFTREEWARVSHAPLLVLNLAFVDSLKAPDFFDVGPLQLATHPAFASTPFAGGKPTSGLTLEKSKGIGQGEGGSETKFALTLNAPKLLGRKEEEKPGSEQADNPEVFQKWQTSLWFTYDKTDPTQTMAALGKLPDEKLKGGTILGNKGHLILLEAGARLDGTAARDVTSLFVTGGYGYSGKAGAKLQRIGFTVTYDQWTEHDLLAPGREAGAPEAGHAVRVTPFVQGKIGSRFSAGAALSFVTGSKEGLGVSDLRGNLSYTYLGEKGGLPAFKLDLSGSLSRLDWWHPGSPLLWGVQGKVSKGRFFGGAQIMGGAGRIPESRARLIDDKPEKVRVPKVIIFTAGFNF